ncbi:MAG TPA: hypothetical protein VGB53_10060 [Rubricoccaceae bacterium]|jgi:hypothetical protein
MPFSSFQIWNGVILAVTAAVYGSARTFRADPYDASVTFAAVLCGIVALLALVGHCGRSRLTRPDPAAPHHQQRITT